jgi:hypothetical protein
MIQSSNPAAGGRGKRAPYNTTHYRIPDALKSSVGKICNAYKSLVLDYDNPYDQRLIEEAEGVFISDLAEELETVQEGIIIAYRKLNSAEEEIKSLKAELADAEEKAGNLNLSIEEKKLLDRILRQSLKLKANAEELTKQQIREVIAKINRE